MLTNILQLPLLLLFFCGDHQASGEIYFRKGAPHVKLSNDAMLSGQLEYSREGRPFSSFVGVPFGSIPERFQEAKMASAWEGILEAIKPGPACAQVTGKAGQVLASGEEDCLNLNVYVPMNNTRKKDGLPVMVWIHGGGFSRGVGVAYGPRYFMEEDIILVTINYRIGVFGFLSTGDEVIPGNSGMKDQVLALRWIQENIQNFGGDNGKVTIFGESAGGAAVHYLLLSPTTNGLFHRAISQSGSALGPWTFNPDPRSTAVKLATYLKCPSSMGEPAQISSEEIATCLKGLSTQELNEAQYQFASRWPSIAVQLEFVPVKETKSSSSSSPSPFLTESPWSILLENSIPLKTIPWIVGTTEDEGIATYAGFILQDQSLLDELNTNWNDIILKTIHLQKFIKKEEEKVVGEKIRKFYFGDKAVSRESGVNLTNMYSDAWLVHSVRKAAMETALKGEGNPVYLYQYAHQGPVSVMKLLGVPMSDEDSKKVGHGDDLSLQFNLEKFVPGAGSFIEADSQHEAFSKQFVKLWTTFASQGEPSHTWGKLKDQDWKPIPKSEMEGKSPLRWYKLTSNPGYFEEGPLMERALFWDKLYNEHVLPSLLGHSGVDDVKKTEL